MNLIGNWKIWAGDNGYLGYFDHVKFIKNLHERNKNINYIRTNEPIKLAKDLKEQRDYKVHYLIFKWSLRIQMSSKRRKILRDNIRYDDN